MNLEGFERYHKRLFALPKLHMLILLTTLVSAGAAAEAGILSAHPSYSIAAQVFLAWIATTLIYSALAYAVLREDSLLTFKRVLVIAMTGEVFTLTLYLVIAVLLTLLKGITALSHTDLYDYALPASIIVIFFLLRSFVDHSPAKVLALAAALPVILYLPSAVLWPNTLRVFKFALVLALVIFLTLVGGAEHSKVCKKLVQVDTFKLTRSTLEVWFSERVENLEYMFSLNAKKRRFEVNCILFKAVNTARRWGLVAADIHPGPFDSVGSSRLPEQLWKLGKTLKLEGLMFLKKPCTHADDLTSQRQVQKFLDAVKACVEEESFSGRVAKAVVAPVVRSKEITVTCLELENTPLLLVSRSPVPTEDLPRSIIQHLKTRLPRLVDVVLVDAHNCIDQKYQELSSEDYEALEQAVSSALNQLSYSEKHQLKASLSHADIPEARKKGELGEAGLTLLLLEAGGRKFALINFDSNNLRKGLRESILGELSKEGIQAEVVTTDTHAHTGIYRGVKYNPLGTNTPLNHILEAVHKALSKALQTLEPIQVAVHTRSVELEAVGEEVFQRLQEGTSKSMKSFVCWLLLSAAATIFSAVVLALL